MGKTTAQKGPPVVKDGIRHKDVYATAVGDTTKAYLKENPDIASLRKVGVDWFFPVGPDRTCLSRLEKVNSECSTFFR